MYTMGSTQWITPDHMVYLAKNGILWHIELRI